MGTQLVFMPFYIQDEANRVVTRQANRYFKSIALFTVIFFCSFLDNSSLLGLNVEIGKGRKPSYVKIFYSKIFNYPLLRNQAFGRLAIFNMEVLEYYITT